MSNNNKPYKVLVSGGNKGIGLAAVKGLIRQGCEVLLGSRDVVKGQAAAELLGHQVTTVALDLSEPVQLKQQIHAIQTNHPDISILINNAAVLHRGNVLEVTQENFYQSLQVNIAAAFDLIQALVPTMIQQGYGRVVNVSSGWGRFSEGLTGPAAYCVSKAAINALTLSLANDVPDFIKVNAVDPGWTRTDMGGSNASRTPDQAAETIIWLATLAEDGPSGQLFYDKRAVAW